VNEFFYYAGFAYEVVDSAQHLYLIPAANQSLEASNQATVKAALNAYLDKMIDDA
jgi:hypothetical protein